MHAKPVFVLSACVVNSAQLRVVLSTVHGSPTVSPTFSSALLTQVFLVCFSSWLVSSPSQASVRTGLFSSSEDGEGDFIEVPSCENSYSLLLVCIVFAVGFTLGRWMRDLVGWMEVGWVVSPSHIIAHTIHGTHAQVEHFLDCALRCATQQNDPALHRALNFLVLADFYFIRSTLRGNTRMWIGIVFDNV